MILDIIRKKLDEEQEKYILWDTSKCHYHRGILFRGNMEGSTPLPCFRVVYDGCKLPIGLNLDFTTCELIHDLIDEACK